MFVILLQLTLASGAHYQGVSKEKFATQVQCELAQPGFEKSIKALIDGKAPGLKYKLETKCTEGEVIP